MDQDLGGVILAGGTSRRLGRDKASEVLLGRTLLERTAERLVPLVDEIIVVRRAGQSIPELDLPVPVVVVEDAYPDTGPLGGIFTGLRAASSERCLVVACDMPLLQASLLRYLAACATGHDGAVPVNKERFPEPICAVYGKRCLPAMERRLREGLYKITAFFGLVDINLIPFADWQPHDPGALSLVNANTEEALGRVAGVIEAGQ